MDFTFSEDQNAIKDLAHQIFTDRTTDEFLLQFDRNDDVYDDQLWNTLAEQGLLGITIDESFGGTGLGFTELCLMLEEQGRRVSPVPLYSSLVLGVLPISEFGSEAQKQQWLSAVATGAAKLSAAIAESGMSAAAAGSVTAKQEGDMYVLDGQLDCIPDGAVANAIIVPATDDSGNKTLFIVETNTAGVSIEAQETSLGKNSASLNLSNTTVSADTVLGEAGKGEELLAWIELRAEIALCALQLGVTEEALKRTAEYTCERKQFGAPIGAFQAVAMQAADAYINVEAIRSTYWLALYKASNNLPARAETHAAKWFAADAGHRTVQCTQHLHGGMGADVEFPIHRFFLWGKHLGMMLGGRSIQVSKLGQLLATDNTVGTEALEA